MGTADGFAAAVQALRTNRPAQAEALCREHLREHPGSVRHLALLGRALAKQGRLGDAERSLRHALELAPEHAILHEDLGALHMLGGHFAQAAARFRSAVALAPDAAGAHKKLGAALAALGRGDEADSHFEAFFDRDANAGKTAEGADHLKAGRYQEAIACFREVLKAAPADVSAMRYLAVACWRGEKNLSDAEAWLRKATALAPDFTAAWITLGRVLLARDKHMDAIAAYRQAVQAQPRNASAWAGLGSAYSRASYPRPSIDAYRRSLELQPDAPGVCLSYAHALKTVGERTAALTAYRDAVRLRPRFGEAYWSMANLKVFHFEAAEVRAMERQLAAEGLTDSETVHFRFALGKAHEDLGDYEAAWRHYHAGNRRQRPLVRHDPLEMERRHADIVEVFNAAFVDAHANQGDTRADPIFIVGLPRSGSTLVEQILASHSQVEGTSELPILGATATSVGRYRADGARFPQAARDLGERDWLGYGRQYLDGARRHRQTDKPFFTDKMPNNFPLIGFLRLILPNAKIIDARRHPLDSCLGCYKQLFASGQAFTYDLEDLAHYYQQYDRLMRHWNTVFPGAILTIYYEHTVADLEAQVRRLLAHCGLPFEAACLRYFETQREVKTASSEQVRQPIYADALGKWRAFGRHIDWLREELAPVIDALPESVRQAGQNATQWRRARGTLAERGAKRTH